MLSNRRRDIEAQKEKNQRIKVYLIICLGIIFCAVGYFRFFYNKPAAKTVAPASPPGTLLRTPVVPAVNLQPQASPANEPGREEPGSSDTMRTLVRDIFEPGKSAIMALAAAKTVPEEKAGHREAVAPQIQLVLNGMIYSGDNSIAIINGTFQRVGDTIGGYKVVRIGAREVRLKGEDGEITLRIVNYGQK